MLDDERALLQAFDELFHDHQPHPAYMDAWRMKDIDINDSLWDEPLHGRCTSIINDPSLTMSMSIPLIDLSVDECVDMVDDALQQPIGRDKQLLAVCRGVGGEARCPEEIRRQMLRCRSNILTIAITLIIHGV